jgi:hypothetical protein
MIYYGITSRMTFLEYLAFLFDFNSQLKRKLSDEELIIKIIREFPYRKELLTKLTPHKLRKYRAKYNSGILTTKYPAPSIPSFRYIKGVIVSSNNRPLTPREVKSRLTNHYKRWKKANVRQLKKEIAKPEPKKPTRKKKVHKRTAKARRKHGTRKAHKAYSQRVWLQKQLAKLQNISPWDD